jgi:hypothetical protein
MLSVFEYECLVKSWVTSQPQWSLDTLHHPPLLMLDKELILCRNVDEIAVGNNENDTATEEEEEEGEREEDSTSTFEILAVDLLADDPTTIHHHQQQHPVLIGHVHVAYDQTYRVPTLFLDAFDRVSGTAVSLESLHHHLPVAHSHTTNPMNAHITQVEHPYTETPIFMVHPCRTVDVLNSLLGTFEDEESARHIYYLACWMQVYLGSLGVKDLAMSPEEYQQCLHTLTLMNEQRRAHNKTKT